MDDFVQGISPLLIDIIVVVIFLAFIALKGKRGLYSCGMSTLVIILSLTIGIFLSSVLTQPVFQKFYPNVEKQIAEKYDREMAAVESGRTTPAQSFAKGFGRFLEGIGLSNVGEIAENNITVYTREEVLDAAAKTTYKLTRLVLFALCTAIGMFVMTMIKNYFGAVTTWPVIKWIDKAGGMAIGFLECYVILFLIIKGADLLNIDFFNRISEGTVVLDFINSHKDPHELYEIGMGIFGNAKETVEQGAEKLVEGVKDAIN